MSDCKGIFYVLVLAQRKKTQYCADDIQLEYIVSVQIVNDTRVRVLCTFKTMEFILAQIRQ